MTYALLIIPILTFLIFIHELGHYWTAKRAGIRVEEFGFGLPPRMFGIQRGETLWSINWIPVGGFVRVLGEDGKSFDPRSMQAKSTGQRALFMAAGSIMNFLAAFVLLGVVLVGQGEPQPHVYITAVEPNTPAASAGWMVGDRIVEVGNNEVDGGADVVQTTDAHLGQELSFVMLRNGERVSTTVVPREDPPPSQGPTGIQLAESLQATLTVEEVPSDSAAAQAGLEQGDIIQSVDGQPVNDSLSYQLALEERAGESVELGVERSGNVNVITAQVPAEIPEETEPLGADLLANIEFERPSLLKVVPKTVEQFFTFMQRMGEGLMMLIRGEVPFSDVAGPIGMGQLTSEVIEESGLPLWVSILNITIVLSLNLAILNLLPLPALDGGRLLFVVIEVLRRGKRVAPEKEGLVHFVGLVLLLSFMVAVAFMDIGRIVSGDSLLQ